MNRKRIALATVSVAAFLAFAVWGGSFLTQNNSPALGEVAKANSDAEVEPAKADAVRIARDAFAVPAPIANRGPKNVVVDVKTVEVNGKMSDGITFTYWTFDGTVPGQMIRVREGDTVEIRLTNDKNSSMPHSIDLHAVTGQGGGAAATQVMPDETKSFRFKALNPGVYVYHCATPYIPAHVANGMYGLIVVEPAGGLKPVDREFYVMQGDFYTDLRPGEEGHASFDDEALWQEQPNFVLFNGQFKALTGEYAMKAKVGETVRLFVGNGGPNLVSSFHVIGEIFDVVHREGESEISTNIQTTLIPAGGATWVEFKLDVPGDYILVDHSLGRALGKGAIAIIHVEGPENPDIFQPLSGSGKDSH